MILLLNHFFFYTIEQKIDPQTRFPGVHKFSNVLKGVLESLLLSYTRKNNTAFTKNLIISSDVQIQFLQESCKMIQNMQDSCKNLARYQLKRKYKSGKNVLGNIFEAYYVY